MVPFLQSSLWQQPIKERTLLLIAQQIGSDLLRLHEQGLTYAAWDPQHTFVQDQRVFLLETTPATRSVWLPFECVADDPSWSISGLSDVYGLGMLLRSIITKELPPVAADRWLIDMPSLSLGAHPNISARILRAIDLATEQDPALRLAGVEELLLYLGVTPLPVEQVTTISEPETIVNTPVVAPPPPEGGRHKATVLYLALFGVALVAGAWGYQYLTRSTPSEVQIDHMAQVVETPVIKHQPSEPVLTSFLPVEPEPQVVELAPALELDSVLRPVEGEAALSLESVTEEHASELALDDTPPLVEPPAVVVTAPPVVESKPAVQAGTVPVRLAILPWGDVYVNGRRYGASPPLKELKLKPGKYRVQVRNGDLPPYNTSIDLKADSSVTIRHKF